MEQHSIPKDVPLGKRKRTEVECSPSVAQGNSNVSNTEVPPSKRRTEAVNLPNESEAREATESDSFASQYITGEKLGKGSFGTVFEGIRVSDGQQVAIKFASKERGVKYVKSPVESKDVPEEVALMQMICQPPICNKIIQLFDWFDEPDQYILVLERPDPSTDLKTFLDLYGGRISETTARAIMLQVVEAAKQCLKRGVLHRDIKLQNILINTDTSEVKLIDFGCGDWFKKSDYHHFKGTFQYFPPEFFLNGRYQAKPLTVWSLGVLLFRMVCGYLPYNGPLQTVDGLLNFRDCVSDECRNLIQRCLQQKPHRRPNFRQILKHKWFKAK